MDRLVEERTDLGPEDLERLRALVSAWGLVADLALSDLVLWLPTWNSGGWVAAALVRPATAPTALPDDLVGSFVPKGRTPDLDRAAATGRVLTHREGSVPREMEAVPIRSGSRVIAVIARHPVTREGGRLESVYLETADLLLGMAAQGTFPPPGMDASADGSPPRVGDGLLRLSIDGEVTFASPNAVSAFRRLGLAPALEGSDLSRVATRLVHRAGPVDEQVALVAGGRIAGDAEIENSLASVSLRAVPLTEDAVPRGAIVLVRDITDLRRRERALLSKDATLREVHHRVKNNLQTVGALLRLQSRRVQADEAREALAEAGRRVSAIAAVHEILAQEPGDTIDFDEVIDRLVHLARDLAPAHAPEGRSPSIERSGSIGTISTDMAGPLAMAVSEILQNAVEHARAHEISVRPARADERIVVHVVDDGGGFADGAAEGLGLQIVRMLVAEDLGGELTIDVRPDSGTRVGIEVPGG
ncbi:MAG: sensor histidine kinase [Candidatus Nanopelagicales bacterium]